MQRSKAGKTELLITRRYFYAWTTWLSRSRWSGNLPYRWMTFYDDDDDAAGAALIRQRDCDRHWSNLLSNKMQAWKILESILITFFVNSWSGLERFEQVRTPASDQYQCIELTRPGSLLTQRTEEKSMIFGICLSTDSFDETFHFLNENSFKTSFTIVNFCDILNNLNLMCVVYKSTMIWTTKLEACPKQPSFFLFLSQRNVERAKHRNDKIYRPYFSHFQHFSERSTKNRGCLCHLKRAQRTKGYDQGWNRNDVGASLVERLKGL